MKRHHRTLKIKASLFALAIAGIVLPLSGQAVQRTICNPMDLNYDYRNYGADMPVCIEGADPVVVLFHDEYYLFSSMTMGYWVSPDLAEWEYIPCSKKQLPDIHGYAPAAMVMDDAVYFHQGYHTYNMWRSTNPRDPDSWENVSTNCYGHHDPAIYHDPDADRVWLTYGCGDLKTEPISVQELDRKTLDNKGAAVDCIMADQSTRGWERTFDNNTATGWGFTEGSQIFKVGDRWYLIYSGYSLFKDYANGLFTSDHPTGPYTYYEGSPVSHKNTGFVGSAGHGCFFQDKFGNWWNATCASVYATHPFERRLNLFPAGIDVDGNLYTMTALGDYPVTLPEGPRDHRKLHNPGWMLLSKNAKVTASSEAVGETTQQKNYGGRLHESQGKWVMDSRDDHSSKYGVDDDIRTIWSATSGKEGEWFQIDLGRVCTVAAVQVNYGEYQIQTTDPSKKYHSYRVEVSTDLKTWSTLIDKWENKTHEPHDYIQLEQPVKALALRVVNRQMPGDGWFALRDLRVFGSDGGAEPGAVADFTSKRHPDDMGASLSWKPVENADTYVVRYGIHPGKLYNQYQVDEPSAEVRTLNAGVEYFFRVDTVNANGLQEGRKVSPLPSGKMDGVYEIEEAVLSGAASGGKNANASGGGYVGNMHRHDASCSLTVDGGRGGKADLLVRYSTALDVARIMLVVNGEQQEVVLPSTGSWQDYQGEVTESVTLKKGDNTIILKSAGSGANLDSLEVKK